MTINPDQRFATAGCGETLPLRAVRNRLKQGRNLTEDLGSTQEMPLGKQVR